MADQGPGKGWGGKRRGSGAPKGNKNSKGRKNRLTGGRRIRDPLAKRLRASLNDDQWQTFLMYQRAVEKEPLPPIPPNVTPLHPFHSDTTTTTTSDLSNQDNQGNQHPFGPLVARLSAFHFRAPADFVRRHFRYLPAIEDALAYVEELNVQEYQKLRNVGALLNSDIHKAIGSPQPNGRLACPACSWQSEANEQRASR